MPMTHRWTSLDTNVLSALVRIRLLAWIAALGSQLADRIIPVSDHVAAEAGRLRAAAEGLGRIVEGMDALMAASALSRATSFATGNKRDFEAMGLTLIDPWRRGPAGTAP